MSAPAEPPGHYWKERCFWLAVCAGPCGWLLLYAIGLPVNQHWPAWHTVFWAGLIYPVLEEYVFRGGLQAWLYTKPVMQHSIAGITGACVITSLVFASAHLLNHTPLWAGLVIVPSLVFGWMRDRYQSIAPGTVLHIIYNTGFISLYS